jgi:hypothetical protein
VAADSSGNLFVISAAVQGSGRPRLTATKIDLQGNLLGVMEFGGSSAEGTDVPSSAVVDSLGNLIVAGTTTSPDFPLVTPLFSMTTTQAGFVIKFDPQLKKILFSTRLGGTQCGGPLNGGTSASAVTVDSIGNIYVHRRDSGDRLSHHAGSSSKQPPRS